MLGLAGVLIVLASVTSSIGLMALVRFPMTLIIVEVRDVLVLTLILVLIPVLVFRLVLRLRLRLVLVLPIAFLLSHHVSRTLIVSPIEVT